MLENPLKKSKMDLSTTGDHHKEVAIAGKVIRESEAVMRCKVIQEIKQEELTLNEKDAKEEQKLRDFKRNTPLNEQRALARIVYVHYKTKPHEIALTKKNVYLLRLAENG